MRIKIFLISFILSLPFWWGVNLLEKDLKDFFFWQEISQNPQIFIAQITPEFRNFKPIRDKKIEDLEINGRSVISVFINNQGEEKVLFEKDVTQKLPIASLTKLMTALIVLEHYDLSKEIKISKEAVKQDEDFGKLEIGKIFPAEYFLYPLLIESSNDAAFALANDYDEITKEEFVKLMNLQAETLGLQDTCFINSTGLDPDGSATEINPAPCLQRCGTNYSTAVDLVELTKELLKKPLIWKILSTSRYDLRGPELINTNKLLGEIPEIKGGKTGFTEEAGECMLLVIRAPKNNGLLINIIIGTDDRFGEMRRLLTWVQDAYRWSYE